MLPATPLVASAASRGEASLTLLVTIALLMVVVLVTAIIIIGLGRWLRRPDAGSAAGASLSLFRSLYERGECSKEEYERIRARLGKKLKQELQLPEGPITAPHPEGGVNTSDQGTLPGRGRPDEPGPTPPAAT